MPLRAELSNVETQLRLAEPLVRERVTEPSAPRPSARERGVELEGARSFLVRSWTGTCFPCLTGPSKNLQVSTVVAPESFTAMLVADLLLGIPEFRELATGIVEMLERELGDEDVFYFFKEHTRLPADADCTAVGLSVLLRALPELVETAHTALDRIAANANARGVVETYFDPSGERSGLVDPVVCANVLFLAHQLGRQDELSATEDFLLETLIDGSYLTGTRYYPAPETFLYFVTRILRSFPHSRLAERVRPMLRQAIIARVGTSASPIDLAQRVLICSWLGLRNTGEATMLAKLQDQTGAWPADSLFQYGRSKVHFGSSGLSTSMALAALHSVGMLESIDPDSGLASLRGVGFEQDSGMEFHFAVLDDR
ncbi:hypothetical protein ACNOYE_02775 [Nannocystaceae bacterium ST9]